MRILYLSGHYPPDLTSGATLQVQRLAHAATRAGHEVRVVAGAYRAGLADGELLDAVDPVEGTDGVAVRWIGSTGWTDQDHAMNWWNPRAAEVVGALLDEWPADVVHAHALQTLGASVLEEASRRGVRTVVTMHDLWWWCGRLFLVDRDLRPCSLVTCLGECPCARTASWRVEREQRLREVLARVDLVLTPSAVLRDVVVANGLDASRVRVDPNDIDIPGRVSAPDRADVLAAPDVRFLYLGGPNPLKGGDVITAAARHLAGTNGWRLVAHGLDPVPDGLPERATVHPAFDPGERAAVLAAADVLVLPSVARESYSLAAREALAAGLAVITSDCLGPEEVVRHGMNGLIVPTGDATALARTMARLAQDRGLLADLRAGAAATPLPTLDAAQHLTDLLRAYMPVATAPRGGGAPSILAVVDVDGDATRERAHCLVDAARLAGGSGTVLHVGDPGLVAHAASSDVTVLVRLPLTSNVAAAVTAARAAGRRVVFDADDLTGLHGDTLMVCDGVIAATEHGARALGESFDLPARCLAPTIGRVDGVHADRARRAPRRVGPLRIGVLVRSATDATAWRSIEPVVAATLTPRPDVELHLLGDVPVSALCSSLDDRIVRHGVPTWRDMPGVLADLDVLLAPVTEGDNPANHHDVAMARLWLAAAAVETAVIATDTTTIRALAERGRDVALADSPDAWRVELETLVDDDLERRRLASRALRTAMLRHGPAVLGARLAELTTFVQRAVVAHPPIASDLPPASASIALEPHTVTERPGEHTGIARRLVRRLRGHR